MAAPKRKPSAKRQPASSPSARILVVEARFYNDIADALLAGCAKALDEARRQLDSVTVPGSLEIVPAIAIAVEAAEKQKKPYDGVVALGCVIQGETFHFDIVAMQSARALIDYSVAQRLPVGNGILTVDNEPQAWARARLTEADKGGDAARAALALIALKRRARQALGHGAGRTQGGARPTAAAPRGSPRCRRSIRWIWRRRRCTKSSPSSKAIGSAARSRASNIFRRRRRFSATWSAAWCAEQRGSIR